VIDVITSIRPGEGWAWGHQRLSEILDWNVRLASNLPCSRSGRAALRRSSGSGWGVTTARTHRHVSRLVADSRFRSNGSIIAFQGMTMGDSFAVRTKILKRAGWFRMVFKRTEQHRVRQNSEKQFKSQGTVQRQVEFQLREGSLSWSSGA
jgi:hypothetical protein